VIAFADQRAVQSPSIFAPTSIFSPSPEQIDAIIRDFVDPDLSMGDIASRHGTTIEGLSRFLSRIDIRDRLGSLEAALAERTRVAATDALASIASSLNKGL
jgi:hypothetical protein